MSDVRFGVNLCTVAPDPYDPVAERLHHDHRNGHLGDFKDVAYTVAQVQDADGPFDGWWYVDQNKLQVKRVVYVNDYLQIGSVVDAKNMEVDRALKKPHDFRRWIRQINAHENMHGQLMQEFLGQPGSDPAPKIEPMIAEDGNALTDRVDTLLRDAEQEIINASNEAKVHARLAAIPDFNRSGKVMVPTSDGSDEYESWPIPNFAALGDVPSLP
jgi:hypothetical protein